MPLLIEPGGQTPRLNVEPKAPVPFPFACRATELHPGRGHGGHHRGPSQRLPPRALQAAMAGPDGVPARVRERLHLHVHRHADLQARVQILIEKEATQRRHVQGSRRAEPDRRRLLPDAVQDPAEPRAGAPDDRRAEAVGPSAVRPCPTAARRASARRSPGSSPVTRSPRKARSLPAADETKAQSRAIDRVSGEPARLADPQQPAGGRQLRVVRCGAGCAGSPTRWRRRTSSRTSSSSSSRRRKRPTGSAAARRAAQAGRGQRAGAAALSRATNDAVSLEERQNIVVQKLADLNAAVTRAKTERIQKEAAYNQIRALQNDRAALDTFPAILSNTFIQQQKSELADLQRQQAQLSEKLGPEPSRDGEARVGDSERPKRRSRARSPRSSSRCRTTISERSRRSGA